MTGLAATQGGLRVVRGAVLAGFSAALAVIAHIAGGGAPPDAAFVLVVAVVLAAAGAGLARRRGDPLGILGVLSITQVGLHFLLAATGEHSSPGQGMPSLGWGMLAAHAGAVVITALMLAKADAAVFAVVAALARLVPRGLVFVPAESPPAVVIDAEPIDAVARLLLRRVCPRRGPPADS